MSNNGMSPIVHIQLQFMVHIQHNKVSSNGPCSNNICPIVVHFQKKMVSSAGSCPNNICAMVVNRFINMYVHQ